LNVHILAIRRKPSVPNFGEKRRESMQYPIVMKKKY